MAGCNTSLDKKLFKKIEAPKIGIDFKNIIEESDSVNVVSFTNIYNGGGVGIADFNADGRPDVFFTGNMVSSRLYLNESQGGMIKFQDITNESGIATNRWCTGVTIADINDDGWPDIYISVSGNSNPALRQNYLFIHQGLNKDGLPHFRELAKAYGLADQTYSTQATFFDYDRDGDLDCFVAVNYADQFYGASVNIPTPNQMRYSDRSDRLYRNIGIGTEGHPVFEDISVEAGILHEGYTLGLVVYDINLDGFPDIYLANDFLSNDILYLNMGDGTFINKVGTYFKHTTFAGMGMDISDYNNDSWPDIFVLDMTPADNKRQKAMLLPTRTNRFMTNLAAGYYPQYNRNTLQLNNGFAPNGDLSFSEIGQLANIHHTDWSWTILLGDFNNSGFKDAMVCNGFRRDLQDLDNIHFLFGDNPFGTRENWEKEFVKKVTTIDGIYVNNYLFENNQDLSFSDRSKQWGFDEPGFSNGGVFVDFDDDGDLDIIINNLDDFPFIYENTTSSNNPTGSGNYLNIRLMNNVYNGETAGTKINLHHNETSQYYQHYLTRGYLSSLDPQIHFGVGRDSIIGKIEIIWPDGYFEAMENIPANQTLTLLKGKYKNEPVIFNDDITPFFHKAAANSAVKYKHDELPFDDFDLQPLLLHKYSQNGPGMAVADVNGDGLDDLFIGGSRTFPSVLCIQETGGGFICSPFPDSELYEDMGAIFFDADGDGDQDLYVVTGGAEYGVNSDFYLDRLYVNDGNGIFHHKPGVIPTITESGSCVVASDYNQDGRLDLFVGGRVSPGKFPQIPKSYLLRNDSESGNIKFTDVTDEIAPGLSKVGMVTAALWTDYDNDNLVDLMVVGEWMPVTIFRNSGSSFQKLEAEKTGLESSEGWWNSVIGADFDKDGDIDYIVGNLGRNSWLKASTDEPLSLYADDFDRDGIIDPLFFNFVDGVKVPFHSRSLLVKQLNFLDKKYPTHRAYAEATFASLLSDAQIAGCQKFQANTFNSSYIENLGNNQFEIKPLHNLCQTSPIFGLSIGDFNEDGSFDVLMVGNAYSTALRLGWYDASIGIFLKGKGDGSFEVLPGTKSGFFVDTDAKSMVQMTGANSAQMIVVASNDDSLKVFETHRQASLVVYPKTESTWAQIFYFDGSKQKIEFYRGAGYLSAELPRIYINEFIHRIEFYNRAGIMNDVFER